MTDQVSTIAVDSTQWWPVIVGRACNSVEVIEDYLGTSIAFRYRGPGDSGSGGGAAPGTPGQFTPMGGQRYFREGDVAGYLKADSGSATMRKTETFCGK